MEKIKVVYLVNSSDKHTIERLEIPNELDSFYTLIDCDIVDIVVRKINGVYYNLIVDDNGKLKNNPKLTLIEKYGREFIVGNIIICPINDTDSELLGSFKESQATTLIDYLKSNSIYEF